MSSKSRQQQLFKFFADWYKIIVLILVALLGMWFSQQPIEQQGDLQKYLNGIAQWLPLTVLIWMGKVEVDLKEQINQNFKDLQGEIYENELMLAHLWNKFSRLLGDKDFDESLREIIGDYAERLKQNDIEVSRHAKKVINKAGIVLQQQEFTISFRAILDYPQPYYKKSNKEIIATNIGSVSKGFWGRIGENKDFLIQLNQDAIERNKANGNKGFQIKRVFILKQDDINKELVRLMQNLSDIEVKVRYLNYEAAQRYTPDNECYQITGLEDFTVFNSQDNSSPSYSGRLKDLNLPEKMIISSNPQVIECLRKQFDALWSIACDYTGETEEALKQIFS